jgi:hypothetical protein
MLPRRTPRAPLGHNDANSPRIFRPYVFSLSIAIQFGNYLGVPSGYGFIFTRVVCSHSFLI